MRLYSVVLIIFAFTVTIKSQNSTPPETVKSVDLKKYVGVWYEIAKIPNWFQKSCSCCTTAEYILESDGKIKVINSCTQSNGNRKITEGVAKIISGSNNSKLEVSFFSILGIRPFWGDYWIIGLDENYSYAVVGSPDRKYGWILSRTAKLSEQKSNEAFEILRKKGYDTKTFEFSGQN